MPLLELFLLARLLLSRLLLSSSSLQAFQIVGFSGRHAWSGERLHPLRLRAANCSAGPTAAFEEGLQPRLTHAIAISNSDELLTRVLYIRITLHLAVSQCCLNLLEASKRLFMDDQLILAGNIQCAAGFSAFLCALKASCAAESTTCSAQPGSAQAEGQAAGTVAGQPCCSLLNPPERQTVETAAAAAAAVERPTLQGRQLLILPMSTEAHNAASCCLCLQLQHLDLMLA